MLENTSLLAASGFAFVAGLASFLSPCVLPMAPVYLASLAGPEILDTTVKQRRLPIFLHSSPGFQFSSVSGGPGPVFSARSSSVI